MRRDDGGCLDNGPGDNAANDMTEHPRQVLRFVARFDRGDYWLAHEELEDLWLEDRGDFYKGLIQIAAAFVHVNRNNWNGATKLLSNALRLLDDFPDQERGFDLAGIRRSATAALEHLDNLKRRGQRRFDESLRFRMRPYFAGNVREDLVEEVELPYRVRRHDEAS